jgi:Ca-activated chloride channel family protein
MTLASPALLAAGLLIAAALGYGAVVVSRRRAAALAAAGLAGPRRARQAGVWLTITGIAVLAIAVAGPAASLPVPRQSGTVILAMDVSSSMSAKDVAPDRLAAAQRAARSFIAAQPSSIDIGVVAFANGALITGRPTGDHAEATAVIRRLKASGGTSLGPAVIAALSAITGRAISVGRDGTVSGIGYWPSATIVIFSDGQDESPASATATATATAAAEKAGVRIDTVGIGSTAGTTVDVDGYHLFTALDAGALRSIARATRGTYYPVSDAGQLDRIASTIRLRLTVTSQRLPLAGAFIALAMVLLAAGSVLTVVRSGRVI